MTITPRNLSMYACSFFLLSCAAPSTTQSTLPADSRQVVRTPGDTTFYAIEFQDDRERHRFIGGLDNLVERHAKRIETDTVATYVHIRVLPARPDPESDIETSIVRSFPSTGDSVPIVQTSVDTPSPVTGGTARAYYHRSYVDENLFELISTGPLKPEGDSLQTGYFTVSQPSSRRIRLALPDKFVNGAGQPVSAFDLVDAWNTLARTSPATARGLFRNVAGLEGMIRGQEATMQGIRTGDERSIVLTFTNENPDNVLRLHSPALLPSAVKLGPYWIKETKGALLRLAANASCPAGRGYFDNVDMMLGGDGNPLLSFSLGKYDVVFFTAARDREYAESKLADKGSVTAVCRDHYFLSLATPSPEIRAFVRSQVSPAGVLARAVKAEGPLLSTIADTVPTATAPLEPAKGLSKAPFIAKPLVVVFRRDDPASQQIADHLLAELTRVGVGCQLKPCEATAYEQALVARSFDVAVCWTPGSTVNSPGEASRISSTWFGDQTDENVRLQENFEIPLFAVTTYALTAKDIGFHGRRIAGICRFAEK